MLLNTSISQLEQSLQQKKISSVELVTEALSQATAQNKTLSDFITLREKEALLTQASSLDAMKKPKSRLHGIPFSLKDTYATKDVLTTAGSNVLQSFIPPYNATVYQKLLDAGAILIGKNNQDAFGHGSSNENTDFSPAKNPWNTQHIPGGSSGGSAISIATRAVSFAIGEDTGGSIRNPASMCGISGLKVTYGRVSRYGAVAYASSLDSVGPMAKSAEDLALILEVIAGADPLDATTATRPSEPYATDLNTDMKKVVIGNPKEFFAEGIDPEVKQIVLAAAEEYRQAGATLEEVSIPFLEHSIAIYYSLAMSEASSNLARYDGVRYGASRDAFTQENKRRIMGGTFALSSGYADKFYKTAQKARTVLIEEYAKVFQKCDVLLAPVTPTPAAQLGQLLNDPLTILLEDLYTVTINTVGVPSLAIPAGFTKNKLPVGMQLIGKKYAERQLLQIGHAYQQRTDWHTQQPPTIGTDNDR
ncbi:MAG: Asp-tRNA(Asn)/Glu-tRNA(Gln) amidotransferase subunit GatA [Patescibacteria group bacterium]